MFLKIKKQDLLQLLLNISLYIAKEWTDLIVTELNNFYKVKDRAEAQAAVNFLNAQMTKTSFAEIKSNCTVTSR